jgi:hypothetical protein
MKKIILILLLWRSPQASSYLEFLLHRGFPNAGFSVTAREHAFQASLATPRVSEREGRTGSETPKISASGLAKRSATGRLASMAFNALGPNYPIGRMFVSGDNLYATGAFSAIGKTPVYGMAEWDGREWKGLGEGFLDPVVSMAFSDSLVFAGGYFSKAGGAAIPYLAQWNGSQWAAVGPTVLQKPVLAMAYSGGSLFVGVEGKAGDSVTGIARWNGSAWSSLGGGTDSAVYCLKTTATGVYAGGNFTRIGGVSAAGVAEWAQGQWHPLGTGLPGRVSELEAFGGDVFAAGYFRLGPDSTLCYFARWEGSTWTCVDIDPQRNFSPVPVVTDLAADNGKLYASAAVHTTEATEEFQAFQFNGSQWTRMGSVTEAGVSVEYSGFASLAAYQGKILLAGDYSKVGARAIQGLASWDGTAWFPWPEGSTGLGIGNFVSALAPTGGGILAGGAFSSAGGSLMNGLGLFDGNGWSDMGFPDSLTANGGVIAIAGAGDNIFTGSFVRNPVTSRAIRIRRLQAGQWTILGDAHGENGEAGLGSLLSRDGGVYAAGQFDTIGGVPARNIAYWDGHGWHALGTGLSGRCRTLEWDGEFLYAGGDFDSAGGAAAHCIARWNGVAWSPLGSAGTEGVTGVSSVSIAVIRKQGARLVVGGNFREAGGIESRNIASWSSSQGWVGNWTTYESAMAKDIVVRDDSVLILAYSNAMKGPGEGYTGIAIWSGKEWAPIETQIRYEAVDGVIGDGSIQQLALAGNELYAGGIFTMVGNVPSNYFAQWSLSDGIWVRRTAIGGKAQKTRSLLFGSAVRENVQRFLERNPGAPIFDLGGRRVRKITATN